MSYARQLYHLIAKPCAYAFAAFTRTNTDVTAQDTFLVERNQIRLDKELARGAQGIVYRGELKRSPEAACEAMPVAIKYCPFTADTLAECKRERDMMKFLTESSVQNVMRLIAYAETERAFYLVMEYMPNGDLLNFLARNMNTLTEAEVYRIVTEIAEGVASLHAVNVFHGDIKLENIFVDANKHVKLGDFRDANVNNHLIQISGTVEYNPPELYSGIQMTDRSKTDMYSFGMAVYVLIQKETPYHKLKLSRSEIVALVSRGGRPEISGECEQAQPKLAKLIRWCWQQDPKKRPSAAQALTELKTGGMNEMSDALREKQFSIDDI